MKDINWKNILTILFVAVFVAPIVAPFVLPQVRKLPLIGKFY